MKTYRADDKHSALQAAGWLETLKTAGPREQQAFAEWLLESRRHVRNFLLLIAFEKELGRLDPEREYDIDAMLAAAAASPLPHPGNPQRTFASSMRSRWMPGKRTWLTALAASTVVAVLSLTLAPHFHRDTGDYVTETGEQRSFKLPDGSLVHLNTRSHIVLQFSAAHRDVNLLEGEALFIVEKDASRPFRVITDTAVAQAIGTQFNVYKHAGYTTISVVEGRVKVTAPSGDNKAAGNVTPAILGRSKLDAAPLEALAAGEEAIVSLGGAIVSRIAPDPTAAVAWRERRLAFQDDTLADIVRELNRYNSLQIRLEGESVKHRKFTGVLDADKPGSLLRLLSTERDLRIEERGDEMVVRLN